MADDPHHFDTHYTDLRDRELAALEAIPDPAERIHAVNAAIKAHSSHTENLAAITRRTAQQLHETLSYADIAALLGISRARAQQLAGPGRSHQRQETE